MIFSSTTFIFIFLPVVLSVYFLIDSKFRNFFILIASLFFYAWGEYAYVLLMILSIGINYTTGILISMGQHRRQNYLTKSILTVGIIINLLILIYYKYTYFLMGIFSNLGVSFNTDTLNIRLPIGISFFTFQSISYLIDVYRQDVKCQKNIINLGMYISLFPQLIAGPIVRYIDISKEIKSRNITTESFAAGISKFIIGLAKKVIISNNVGLIADKVFEISASDLSTSLAWIGILCYSLQIYYDFSGYSDMAIGLGRLFGFNFKENFNHPYISTSVQDFWRRWHISLSTWFKDYLYIPLGGNRKGAVRTYMNLVIVFFVTGLWHGASWNFVLWGLFHGLFLIIERASNINIPAKWVLIKRVYLLLVVMIGWVLFRSEDLNYSILFIKKMFSFTSGMDYTPYLYINSYTILIAIISIAFATPLYSLMVRNINMLTKGASWVLIPKIGFYLLLLAISAMELAQTTYNPFIYFRF